MKSPWLLVLLVLFVSDPGGVRGHYDTRAALMADGGGGLPAVLPGSAHDISIANHLKPGAAEGDFGFSDTDAGAFFGRLTLGAPAQGPFDDWEGIVREHRASGRVAWTYRERNVVWTFFCHPVRDRCDFLAWSD